MSFFSCGDVEEAYKSLQSPPQSIQMQSAPGTFSAMLKEVSGRFRDTAASYEAVQELEHTIASLQQIKNGLEETNEYRAAQAEKERASKGDRVQQLEKRIEESKAAAERLLGFPLTPGHCTKGNVYGLLPIGYVDRLAFEQTVQSLERSSSNTEERLDQLKGELGDLKSRSSWSAVDRTKSEIMQLEQQAHLMRSRLLGYMMSYQPMLDATFSDTLAAHLDAMLDAYLELRKLQA
jgi:DNA repair exonuclease SbcCD ATPase subunit